MKIFSSIIDSIKTGSTKFRVWWRRYSADRAFAFIQRIFGWAFASDFMFGDASLNSSLLPVVRLVWHFGILTGSYSSEINVLNGSQGISVSTKGKYCFFWSENQQVLASLSLSRRSISPWIRPGDIREKLFGSHIRKYTCGIKYSRILVKAVSWSSEVTYGPLQSCFDTKIDSTI